MNMKLQNKIKARDFLDLVYCLTSKACIYHGMDEDECENLTLDMFIEFIENEAENKKVFTLFTSK